MSNDFESNYALLYEAQQKILDNVTGFVLTCFKEGYLENLLRAGEKITKAINDELPDIANKRSLKIDLLTKELARQEVELNRLKLVKSTIPRRTLHTLTDEKPKTDDEIMKEASDRAYDESRLITREEAEQTRQEEMEEATEGEEQEEEGDE